MFRVSNIFFLTSITFLISCSSNYQRASFYNTEGFIDTRLGRDVFKITYNGSIFTNLNTAIDFCLLRCAEISLERGFRYFRVTRENSGIGIYLIRNPDLHGTIDGYPVQIPGGISHDVPRAVSSNIIVCSNEIPRGSNDFLNAENVRNMIQAKYSRKTR